MIGEIKFYWRLMKIRMPYMLAIVTLCASIGIGLAITKEPRYSASATLLVEGAKLPESLFTSTVQDETSVALQGIMLRLLTRANLIETAAKNRIFHDEDHISPTEVVSFMRENSRIRVINGREHATLLQVSFEGADPEVVAGVVNDLVTRALREHAARRKYQSDETLNFFEERVNGLSERLSNQRANILAIKEANKDALPEELQFRLNRQSSLQERLTLVERDRVTLVEQRNRLITFGSRAVVNSSQRTPNQLEVERLEAEIRSKLAFYAPDSPTIAFLRRQVEILQPKTSSDSAETDNGSDPVFEFELAEIDARIEALDEESSNIEAELVALRSAIERTQKVSAQLEVLQRNYAATNSQYNEAVHAREVARQGVDVEAAAKGERLVLIEPASVPKSPSAPNRKLIAGGGVFIGVSFAAIFFILSELLSSAIRRPDDLLHRGGAPLFATIPYFEDVSTRRRRKMLQVGSAIIIILSIPFGIAMLHLHYLPLDDVVELLQSTVMTK